MMEKLTENQLKILFTNQKDMGSIEAMIVSACHSQKMGELMIESGIPVVIAINAPFKIQDEAARTFGKAFHSALVQGSSYEEAYRHAKSSVAGSMDPHSIYSCCCAHPHTDDCLWKKELEKMGQIKAHELHLPTCK